MTLSDAEEDQPSANAHERDNNSEISIDSSNLLNSTLSINSAANNLATSIDSSITPQAGNYTRNCGIEMDRQADIDDHNDENSSSGQNEHNPNRIVQNENLAEANENEITIVETENTSINDLEYMKVKEKLEQIDRYIEQTTNAMQTLENEGDLESEDTILLGHFDALFDAVQIRETECYNILNKSLLLTIQQSANVVNGIMSGSDDARENGSESLGMVESMNEDNNSRLTMHDQLNRHQNEQELLSARLRESLVRRQELMIRYQATRERLNNLKRQRSAIADEERSILQDAGADETPYDDPIPGVENWTLLQLENSIEDFRLLRDRVDGLHEAYNAKLHVADENDTESVNDIRKKIEKVLKKRCEIENAVTKMIELLEAKRESEIVLSDSSISQVDEISLNISATARAPIEEDITKQQEEIATEDVSETREELLEKQKYLQGMREQLATMKQLLSVTTSDLNAETSAAESNTTNEPIVINEIVVGVNGDIIELSDSERRDPLVVSKYRQLSLAKKRLEKMEEVMNLIAEARDSGKPIHEILSPENLAILAEAQEDERVDENDQIIKHDELPVIIGSTNSPSIIDHHMVPESSVTDNEDLQIAIEHSAEIIKCSSTVLKRHPAVFECSSTVTKRSPISNERSLAYVERSSPAYVERSSPAYVERSSPAYVERSSPAYVERSSPAYVERSSPAYVERSSPAYVERSSPAYVERSLPAYVERSSPAVVERSPAAVERSSAVVGRSTGVIEKSSAVVGRSTGVIEKSQSVRNRINAADSLATPQHLNMYCVPVNERQDRQSDWEREREISAMQYRLKKKTSSGISSINDGSRVGREKGAIKKQTRNLFCEGSDPRVTEMLVLQEELKEKKNALEALMKKMGKSSSFALDNFSDNISENVSDLNSETFERPTASWGDARYLSDPSPSDIEAVVATGEDLNARFEVETNAAYSSMQACAHPKNKDRVNANKTSQKPQFSVNNLRESLPRSVRSKQNRSRGGSIPAWENIPGNSNQNHVAHDSSGNKLQNTVFSAMTQLNQVQEAINSLYDELRNAERAAVSMQANAPGNMFANGASVIQPNIAFPTNSQNVLSNYQQLMNSQASGGLTNPMLAGLQQCYSQLYLHSLEIQSLNKHLQIINQRESSTSPPYPRAENVQRMTDQPQRDDDQRFPFNSKFCDSSHTGDKQMPMTFPVNDRISINDSRSGTYGAPNGISNPIYATINTQPTSSWTQSGDKNFFPSFNETSSRRCKNDTIANSSYSLDHQAGHRNSSWAPMSSIQINNHQSSDILNNQVLPGSRANNYWDNFRSYSHQNPLSTTAKSNTDERRVGSSNSLPGISTFNTSERLIRPSTSFENWQYNLTGSNNSINKASDKNSSSTRSQNRNHIRDSQFQHMDSRMSSALGQRQRNRKRNNRFSQGGSGEREEISGNFRLDTSDLAEADSFRRTENDHVEERGMNSESIYEMGEPYVIGLNPQNTTSQEDLSTSEAHSQVIREAESLMQKHSEQPEFLLQLFHHASRITRNTDQHVALELLRELSNQRQQSNIQDSRWNSNLSVTPSESMSFNQSVSTREERTCRNNTRLANKQTRSDRGRGISGSDASESGITSEEEEMPKGFYQPLTKNTSSMSPGLNLSEGSSPLQCSGRYPSCIRVSPIPSLTGKYGAYKEAPSTEFMGKIKFENQDQRIKNEADNITLNELPDSMYLPTYNALQEPISSINYAEVRSAEDHFSRKRQSPRRKVTQGEERQTNLVLKNRQKNFNAIAGSQSGFVSIVSAALNEALRVFEWPENNMTSNVQLLEMLHQIIMKQVQIQSSSMGFSANFVSSIEAQLKTTLQGFYGKRISQIKQELTANVRQVLIHQYCSQLVHQDNSVDYIQPQTPDSNHIDASKFECASSSRSFNNQACVNSLFCTSEGVMKHSRQAKSVSSYSLSNNRDERQHMGASGIAPRDESKISPKNLAKVKGGAVAKMTLTGQRPGTTKREKSPVPEASFPEARIGSGRPVVVPHLDSVISEPSNQRSRSSDNAESAQSELVDPEADQEDLCRSQEYFIDSLPLHDLAEADQSQDAIEPQCLEPSAEDDAGELAMHNQSTQQHYSPIRLLVRRNVGANIGLDEVPTRLLSGPDGASQPLPNNIGNRHPPEGGSSSNESRSRINSTAPQYADSRHPPEGGGAQTDSTGKSG